jgi:hypothetical protein
MAMAERHHPLHQAKDHHTACTSTSGASMMPEECSCKGPLDAAEPFCGTCVETLLGAALWRQQEAKKERDRQRALCGERLQELQDKQDEVCTVCAMMLCCVRLYVQ